MEARGQATSIHAVSECGWDVSDLPTKSLQAHLLKTQVSIGLHQLELFVVVSQQSFSIL
jgi:hypothetical protein